MKTKMRPRRGGKLELEAILSVLSRRLILLSSLASSGGPMCGLRLFDRSLVGCNRLDSVTRFSPHDIRSDGGRMWWVSW